MLNAGCVVFQALLKKHEALMSDIEAYSQVIDGLKEQAHACKVRTPYIIPSPKCF